MLLAIAILVTLFAHPHIIVPIILVIGAIVIAWENYKVIKAKEEQGNDEVQAVD